MSNIDDKWFIPWLLVTTPLLIVAVVIVLSPFIFLGLFLREQNYLTLVLGVIGLLIELIASITIWKTRG